MGLFDRLFGSRPERTASGTEAVVVQHDRANVEAFCLAVCEAGASRRPYGVRLRPEPDNARDRNAIAVDGFAGAQRWHVGYLDRDAVEDIEHVFVSMGIPVDAELRSIRIGDRGLIEIRVVVLAPGRQRPSG